MIVERVEVCGDEDVVVTRGSACCFLGAMVVFFLREAMNNARLIAVGGLEDCVVHIILSYEFSCKPQPISSAYLHLHAS